MQSLKLLLPLLLIVHVRGQWQVWLSESVSAMSATCVVIPCSFTYPSSIAPSPGAIHGVWYYGTPYQNRYPPVVLKTRTDVFHESFAGRTKLLGDLQRGNCTLLMEDVGPQHAGKYFFRADLGGAKAYSFLESTDLKVLEQPDVDVPDDIVSDESLTLTCHAPDNCPGMTPEIQWMYTDFLPDPEFVLNVEEEGNTVVMSRSLVFTPSPMHNGQLLGCRVFYPDTSLVYERLVTLDVKYAPRSVWVNVSSEVMEGSSVTLHCEVDSNPPPRISWKLGDREVLWDTATNLSLTIDEATPEDEGVYTCIGENAYGAMNTSLYLAVKYPPREPSLNDSLTMVEGTSFTLHCSSQGSPPPTLTWLKDGEVVGTVTADELSVLEIQEVTPQDEGQYRCMAENEYGWTSGTLNVTVEYAPVLLEESKCTVVREGVQCVCVGAGNPEPTVEFFLPDSNTTVNETDRRYKFYTHTDGQRTTGMIKLKEKGERGDDATVPAVNVRCKISNVYGSQNVALELQQEKKYLMAVIVGTIGGVAVIAFIIAAVRYVGHNNKKENGLPREDAVLDNPIIYYSAAKKDKQNLRKKVLKTELLGSKFNSILEESTGEDGDFQPSRNLGGVEKRELNLDRPREGGAAGWGGHAHNENDDGATASYSEIKAK
ncbi:myelin-associated glycoprotein isoform X2 [Stigmatopora nigra]